MNSSPLIKPIVTEKSTASNAKGKYVFLVDKNATKVDIKRAFRENYSVEVSKVNILYTNPKMRTTRFRTTFMKRHPFKKATITTKGGKTIDINKFK